MIKQEATPQQKMIDTINQGNIYGVVEAMRLGAKASDIPQDLRGRVLKILQTADFAEFRLAGFNGQTEDLKYHVSLAQEIGDSDLVKQMLQAYNFHAFREAAKKGHKETCVYLVGLANKLSSELADGTDLAREMLKADNYHALLTAYGNGHDEVFYYLATQPSLDIDGRGHAKKRFKVDLKIPGIKIASRDDLYEEGKPYAYASMIDSLSKIVRLIKGLSVKGCDYKKLISNHKNPHRAGVSLVHKDEANWCVLSEVLRNVSYKECNEIVDTAKEATQYVSAYLLVQKHEDKTALKQLSKEQLNEQLEPIKQQVYRYFLERKTLPQMKKISAQWHEYRTNKVKSSEDATTLRDFAQSGSWKQVLETKVISVTDPKLAGYTIVNLIDSDDLMSEHYALKHCVDGYTENCKNGYQVFSIRKDGIPQATMGFKVKDGKLELHQNYGEGNRMANMMEKAVEKWFLDGIKEGVIKIDLSNIGKLKLDDKGNAISEFEDLIGIKLENLTPKRIQSNLNILTSFAKGSEQWREKDQHFMFGKENKGASLEQFAKNIELGVKVALSQKALG